MKKTLTIILGIALFFVIIIAGCKKNVLPLPADTPTNGPVVTATHPPGWIDDCEDGDNVNDYSGANPVHNAGGYWITYDDDSSANSGTSYVWPMSQTWATKKQIGNSTDTPPYKIPPFTMSQPGFSSSPYGGLYAARITGYVTTNSSLAPPGEMTGGFQFGFIGMGIQLVSSAGEPACNEVDISAYTGVKFYTKGDGKTWDIKLPFVSSSLNCDGTITTTMSSFTSSDEYKLTFTPPTGWTQETVYFSNFTQVGWGTTISIASGRYWQGCSATSPGTTPGWTATCPIATVKQHVHQIQFQTDDQSVVYPASRELWIDDIRLF
jgi:hypothetical protein